MLQSQQVPAHMVTGLARTALAYHPEGTVIAGGFARAQWFLQEFMDAPVGAPPAGDVDLFVLDGTPCNGVLRAVSAAGWQQTYAREGSATFVHRDYKLPLSVIWAERPGQFGSWKTAEDLIESFSFRTEMFALWELAPGVLEFVYDIEAPVDTVNRVLHVNRIVDPVRLLWRMNKYGRKGYIVSVDEVQRVADNYHARAEELAREAAQGHLVRFPSDPEERDYAPPEEFPGL